MDAKSQRWALFWCRLLHDLLFDEVSPSERGQQLRAIANQAVVFPDGVQRKPSLSTLRRKLNMYLSGGFDSLDRKPRSDRGRSRNDTQRLIARAIELKKDQPRRGHRAINDFLESEFGRRLPKSTLYRHLSFSGATRRQLGVTSTPVRKTWGRQHTHELWVGDFSHGPYVLNGDQTQSTRLSVFIDSYSRFLVEAHYYSNEKLDVLCDSLLRALAHHGAPAAIYVDNAKVYRSDALRSFCLRLNIRLLHRKPRDPEGGGVVERVIQTIQQQFETEVRNGSILTLDQLNRALAAWVEISYHPAIHSTTREAPLSRMEAGRRARRNVDLQAATESFFRTVTRVVDPDFSDVRIDSVFYRVDPKLRTLKVEVRCPILGPDDTVLIFDRSGRYLGKGARHDRKQGQLITPAPSPKTEYSYLDLLQKKHQQQIDRTASQLEFRQLDQQADSQATFLTLLGRQLGRKGLGDFTHAEIELALRFARQRKAPPAIIARAVAESDDGSVFTVLRVLERLLSKGK